MAKLQIAVEHHVFIYRSVDALENLLFRAKEQLDQARRKGASSKEIDKLHVLIRDALLTVGQMMRAMLDGLNVNDGDA